MDTTANDDLLLNLDVWCYVFDILVVDKLHDAINCSVVCKDFLRILRSESLWKLKSSIPQPGFKTYSKLPNNIDSWFELYKQKVYLTRVVPISAISTYNRDYHCTISKIKLKPKTITLYIDERGDNSLGPIQQPELSRLWFGFLGGNVGLMPLSKSKFSISDSSSQYLGKLVYDIDYLLNAIFIFEYGCGGYTKIQRAAYNACISSEQNST